MVFKVSILILTQERPLVLRECLLGLIKQSVLPNQVVVVDNGVGGETEKSLYEFRQKLKIDYFQERIKGEAFARNRALKLAKGDIIIFIDDDCIADKNWLKNIIDFFRKNPQIKGLVGRTKNLLKNNPYANVYQCYYQRWLWENFSNIDQIQPLTKEKSFFDTKNVAFKKSLIKDFSFDSDVLFHSINVDNVAGDLLVKKGNFFYHPGMIVYHQNWGSFKDLLVKNFYQGVADEWIFKKKNIENRKKPLPYPYLKWLKSCFSEIGNLTFRQKLVFWPMFFLYPFPYKIGRIFYKVKKFQ